MKILIFGHNDWIENNICKILNDTNIDYVVSTITYDNKIVVEKEIIDIKPTHIMSFIERTHVNEHTTIDNVRHNLFSPTMLAILSKKYNIHFTYLGIESNPDTLIGSEYCDILGLFADEVMNLFDETVLNIRIHIPIIDKLEPNTDDIYSTPNAITILDELLPRMLNKLLPYVLDLTIAKITGTVNLTNPGLITHTEILEMYKDIVDPQFTWNNFNKKKQSKIIDNEPSNNCIDIQKNLSIKDIKCSLQDILSQMNIVQLAIDIQNLG